MFFPFRFAPSAWFSTLIGHRDLEVGTFGNLRLDDMMIWRFGDPGSIKSGDLEIWRFGDLQIWRFGDLEDGDLEIWGFGGLEIYRS